MRVERFESFKQLGRYADDWERLACGNPFRSWTWLSHWWRHYGEATASDSRRRRLSAFAVFDTSDNLVGVAPWYLEHSAIHGRVLRPLGCGEVCSDYLGVLCHPATEETIVEVLAEHLARNATWDLLDLDAVDASDAAMSQLAACLEQSGCLVHRRQGVNCWRLPLPVDWDHYVKSLGRNLRREVRRMERELLDSGRAKLVCVTRFDQLSQAMDVLVDLHQRRRHMLGEHGCFASARFLKFYHEVVPEMLCRGRVQFHWLEIDGRPVAAEYQLVGNGVLYAYQAGVDPEAMEHQPGKAINVAILRQAIERGYQAFDFLRGDEPYKARFGATPTPTLKYRIVPSRAAARWRHNVWLAGRGVKQFVKNAAQSLS